jgi:hypothetical protein
VGENVGIAVVASTAEMVVLIRGCDLLSAALQRFGTDDEGRHATASDVTMKPA